MLKNIPRRLALLLALSHHFMRKYNIFILHVILRHEDKHKMCSRIGEKVTTVRTEIKLIRLLRSDPFGTSAHNITIEFVVKSKSTKDVRHKVSYCFNEYAAH